MDLNANKKSVKQLLSVNEQQFRVPPYQRPYAWTKNEVEDLWSDLLDNLDSGHFLGSVVLSVEDADRPQVIDGQQRLTTLVLLLAALRDAYFDAGSPVKAQQVQQWLVADAYATGDSYFKMRAGDANWPVLRDFVLRMPGDGERLEWDSAASLDKVDRLRNRQLIENARLLRELVRTQLDGMDDAKSVARLAQLEKSILNRVELVAIEVGKVSDAFLLFESLNDRGLQLSAADLLKSHLLAQLAKAGSQEDVEQGSQAWDEMVESLSGADVTRFLRHYLLMTYPKVLKDQVYDRFKDIVAQEGASSVLARLTTMAKGYGEFENPGKVQDPDVRRVLEDLRTLRAVSCYIALMPARHYLSAQDFLQFARLAEVLTYRYSSVLGLGTNDLEKVYAEAARILDTSKGAEFEAACGVLLSALPDSEQFRLAFSRISMGRAYLARYTLRKIEEAISEDKEKAVKGSAAVHIEHVMPQKLSEAWRTSLGDALHEHGRLVNRWGNLTLLYGSDNQSASNEVFAVKKGFYKSSQVAMTRALTGYPEWGPEQIRQRQQWLADVADSVWSVNTQAPTHHAAGVVPKISLIEFENRLGADVWKVLEPLAVETTAEEAVGLADRVRAYASGLGHSAGDMLGERLATLAEESGDYDAEARRVLRATVEYFLLSEDIQPDESVDGLQDDTSVFNTACDVLLRPLLKVPLTSSASPQAQGGTANS